MTVKQKNHVTLKAEASCLTHSLAEVSIRDLVFSVDEHIERGGMNKGSTPTDTVLSALVSCTNVIGHKCAEKPGVDIGHQY